LVSPVDEKNDKNNTYGFPKVYGIIGGQEKFKRELEK
jgi:hypothetical protein